MLDEDQLREISGREAYGSDGDKIGKVGQVYLDDQSGRPEWVTVNTGLFGTNESFVPLSGASYDGDRLTVPYSKQQVKTAPNVSTDGYLSPEEERELYKHYGLSYGDMFTGRDDVQTRESGEFAESGDFSGRTGEDAMTRSEERLDVGTRTEETGRARLRKYVTTENVTQTVPVRKEKAVLEREPVTEGNLDDATSGPEIAEGEHEVVLQEERPVVQKTTEPVERVRLGKEQTTEEQTVSEDVRREEIEAEGDITDRR
jgi:uncharacterized protein (TIGR02271 family)